MGRRIVVMKLICSLGHCECDGHTVHKLSQWRLTADWLDPRQNDCLRMHSNVSSDRLPSYIKANWPVLEIFKVAEYFPDSPRKYNCCIICKASGLSAITYRVFLDDSWLSRGWCLCPEGTAVHTSACRRIRHKSRRHVSKPLHRAAPLQRLQPAASERKPPLPVIILCKTVVYSVVSVELRPLTELIVYPQKPEELTCNIMVWKLTGENFSYRRKSCTIATLSTTYHMELLGSVSGNHMIVFC